MLTKLRRYPRIIYMLAFYLLIEQAIYGLLSAWRVDLSYVDEWQPSHEIIKLLPILSAFGALLAGWLTDQFRSVTQGMLVSIAALLGGGVIGMLPYEATYLLGHFILETASFLFFFLVIWHIAILFPVATDWKDNAFLLLYLSSLAAGFLLGLLLVFGMTLGLEEGLVHALIPFGLAVLLILLVYHDRDLGFEISTDAEKPELGLGKWPILIGCTLLIFVVNFASVAFLQIVANEQLYSFFDVFNIFGWWLFSLLKNLLLIAAGALLIYFAQDRSNHFLKLQWALIAIFLVFGLQMLVRYISSYELNELSTFVSGTAEHIIIYPLLLAVLTHVNLDDRTGLWLGIFYGVPSLLVTGLCEVVPIAAFEGFLQPAIAIALLIIAFIFLRENKPAILELLDLEEPNQAPGDDEPEDGEDPIDHLIVGD